MLTGCTNTVPLITDYGRTKLTEDDVRIYVPNAKSGLLGYSITEDNNKVYVLLEYEKENKDE